MKDDLNIYYKKMRNLMILLFLLNMIFSCNSSKNIELDGIYEKHGTGYLYTLNLNSDNTFLLSEKYYEGNPSCKGNWAIKNDTITFKCYEEEIFAQITLGYMNKRVFNMVILNREKLKFGNVILELKRR
ncbi:hypothetical protein [Chryseobacterium sp. JK1]|uniref:hypothetical protein n=1 Tax=Chryseobacterium sp. JK1 TaxID=874294 RepID=UPI003D68F411